MVHNIKTRPGLYLSILYDTMSAKWLVSFERLSSASIRSLTYQIIFEKKLEIDNSYLLKNHERLCVSNIFLDFIWYIDEKIPETTTLLL